MVCKAGKFVISKYEILSVTIYDKKNCASTHQSRGKEARLKTYMFAFCV